MLTTFVREYDVGRVFAIKMSDSGKGNCYEPMSSGETASTAWRPFSGRPLLLPNQVYNLQKDSFGCSLPTYSMQQ